MRLFDSNVIIDALGQGPWSRWATAQLAEAASGGAAINHVVLAELYAGRTPAERIDVLVASLGLEILPLSVGGARRAGRAHRLYRDRGGERPAILADFLIGGHAAAAAMPLVTRDRARFASYFPELTLITPEGPHP